MTNIILSLFYFTFPITYQLSTTIAYWITFELFSKRQASSIKYFMMLTSASYVFFIALFLVISLFQENTVSSGLFPAVIGSTGPLWTQMIRGTWWYYAINILTHTILMKIKIGGTTMNLFWLIFLCNTVSYFLSLLFFINIG